MITTYKNLFAKNCWPRIVLIMTLVLVCSIALLGCDSSSSENDNPTNVTTEIVRDGDTCVLVDDIISASFLGAEDASALGVFYINLKIENHSDVDVVINLENANVDGETIPLVTTGVPLVVSPKNSGQTGFIFSMVNLDISSMEDAEQAAFKIVARNNDTYETVFESEMVTVALH